MKFTINFYGLPYMVKIDRGQPPLPATVLLIARFVKHTCIYSVAYAYVGNHQC